LLNVNGTHIIAHFAVKVKTNLASKVVIVTGASSGIGRETALRFAEAGANVLLAARRKDALCAVVDSRPDLRKQLILVPTDVTKDEDVSRLIDAAISYFGRIDVLVNNAGAGLRAPVAEVTLEDARRLMELNLFAAYRCIRAVLPHMNRQHSGQIVNIGSVLSVVATPRNGLYCASKFALRALSNSLRMELRGTGIDVISVLPGYTDTAFFDNMVRYDGSPHLSPFRGQHPCKVAEAILHACTRRKREISLTASGRLGVILARVSPQLLDLALRRSV
jgi:short-subunit dehydrogenase